jgi:hypothetical protein
MIDPQHETDRRPHVYLIVNHENAGHQTPLQKQDTS